MTVAATLAAPRGRWRSALEWLPLLLAACARAPAPGGAPPAGKPASPAAAPAETVGPLDVERRWLQSWFEGTPVDIAGGADGSLRVTVPREFCFDAGQSRLKPPLAAVLDKVAESLRRRPQLQLDMLAAPADASANAALSRRRAVAVRQHLRSRGVPASALL